MSKFLTFIYIFFIGSSLGWILELFFRRIVHKKWINPGFLVGPYLPIYGFGLCILTFTYFIFYPISLPSIVIILLMGIAMTIIELIGGLFFQKEGIKLWDYSDQFANYKGIICPLFSLIWTIFSGVYYYLVAPHMVKALEWFSNNISFSFILGMFFGIIILDFIYSTKLLVKIRRFAKDNDIEVKYEEFKAYIKKQQLERKEKYSFIFAFKQTNSLHEYLKKYKKNKRKKRV